MSGGNLSEAQTGAGLQQGGLQQQGIQPGNAGQQQPPAGTPITCDVKGDFADWLSRQNGSVVISTYQAGKIAMVGWNGQQTSIVMRDFQKPMGLAVDGKRLAMATRDQVIFFANAKALAHDYMPEQKGRYDALYMPRLYYNTGELLSKGQYNYGVKVGTWIYYHKDGRKKKTLQYDGRGFLLKTTDH